MTIQSKGRGEMQDTRGDGIQCVRGWNPGGGGGGLLTVLRAPTSLCPGLALYLKVDNPLHPWSQGGP